VVPAPEAPTSATHGHHYLCPLLKLSILLLNVLLKVDNPMGTSLHLLMGDVEQHVGVVPSVLGVINSTINLL
jgi:hypothetical protein